MKNVIFMTGSTGQLGSYLLREILSNDRDRMIYLLVRSDGERSPLARIEWLLKDYFRLKKYSMHLKRLKVLEGDFCLDMFGLNAKDYHMLLKDVDTVYHCGALIDLVAPKKKLMEVNIAGTKKILDFVKKSEKVKNFNYISTAFISGNYDGTFKEKDFYKSQEFNYAYEESKFLAEKAVRGVKKKGLNIKIYRPSIIVGDSKTGKTISFQMFYKPIHILSLNICKMFPADPKGKLNVIPVDIAAKEIYLLSVQDEQEISTYHITSENTLCVADVLRAARQCIGLPVVEYVSRERFESQNINIMAKKLFLTFEPYLTFRTVFRNKDTLKKLKRLGYVPKTMGREILAKLFDFAKKKRYLKRMGKRQ